jgi:hypothetical protein
MANFKVSMTGPDIKKTFDLPVGRTIDLVQWGGDSNNKPLALALSPSSASIELKVLPAKLAAASTAFTLRGSTVGTSAAVAAFVAGSGSKTRYAQDLKVKVRGLPTNQPGYSVDLLANIAANGSSNQLHQYSRITQDPPEAKIILSQDTRGGHYNCGDTAASYGPKIFGKDTSLVYYTYYLPAKTSKMADLRFDAARVGQGIASIRAMLAKGKPVRVWLIHDDGFATPTIRDDWRTHFLTIIGYSSNRFLYLDPWPDGSKFKYNGGMYPAKEIAFMGELTFNLGSLELGIFSPSGGSGCHTYKVIAGP